MKKYLNSKTQYTVFSNSMSECLKEFWLSYINIDGRATRSEFWWSYLWYCLIGSIIFNMIGIAPLWYLLIIIPSITVTIRRLHDTNKSAWHILWIFLPFIGNLILLFLLILDGTPITNRYGKPRI